MSAKFNLLFIQSLRSIPRILRRIPALSRLVAIAEKFDCDGMLVEKEGVLYVLVDQHSLELLSRYFEEWMPEYLKLRSDDVFVDVGAHVGKYALGLARHVKLVVAVEPWPKNFNALKRGVELNGLKNVILINKAAWNKKCRMKLFKGTASGQHSVKNVCGKYVEVEALPLDSILRNLNRIDWIKIDVEGAEYEVLQGLQETIKAHRPKIIVEVFPQNLLRIYHLANLLQYNLGKVTRARDPEYYVLTPRRTEILGAKLPLTLITA
jgi:FkbM family methyltransferase